jgi:serine/threonine protein kinase/DNA-binding response OmpR family regulator
MAKLSREEFFRKLNGSGLLSPEELDAILRRLPKAQEQSGDELAQGLIAEGKLTPFQADAVQEDRLQTLVVGNYEITDRLGSGGMGTVYKARHRRMKRIVALKVLSKEVSQDERFIKRFQREVEAVARLNHPNIVMAYDADEAEIGHFLVMEFVNGQDLGSTVFENGALPVPEAVDCILQAARALDYAHREGIIHRDIKPANLLRDIHGVVKVADLGLARISERIDRPGEKITSLTQAGTVMGTPDFMSPEQAIGATDIDHRTDIYSLGCTLYYLLTRRVLYEGPTMMAVLVKHREAAIPALRDVRTDVPAALDETYHKMVAKIPNDRYASMADVIQALENIKYAPAPSPKQAAAPMATMEFTPSEVAAHAVKPQDGPAGTGLAGAQATARTTVLLVEPSRSQAVIIRSYLQKLGHPDCVGMLSGQLALEAARAHPPQLIISAMHLPDMTGVQLVQKIRAEKALASTGFILITSETDAPIVDLAGHAGNVVRLPKPFDQAKLASALAEAAHAAPHSGPGAWDKLCVLVVDDSAPARTHIRSVLAGLGVRHIVEAADGAEGVAALERENCGLVVTDYNMPHFDGRAFIDYIRNRSSHRTVPVIMVTTETDPARLKTVRDLGVTAICDKSFKPEVVRGILERLG